MGAASCGPLRVQRKQPVRVFLFAALVPRVGGGQRICFLLGHRSRMDKLPIPALGPGVEEVEGRRGCSHGARPVVAVVHLVGTVGARRRALL